MTDFGEDFSDIAVCVLSYLIIYSNTTELQEAALISCNTG